MDQVRGVMRLHHYSIHTERSYCDWIVRYVAFHRMQSREDLVGGEAKIEAFLTHLAQKLDVAPSTQNQALNALVFLYKAVLKQPLDGAINAVRAESKSHIPVVLTTEEVVRLLVLLEGVPQLVVKVLYGSGLRINEAIRWRVQDVDIDMKQISVRDGKGNKDRVTTFPASIVPALEAHLKRVKLQHEKDLADGFGEVYLPHALDRKYRGAAKSWGWQYVFPAREISRDPRSGLVRRHHIDPSLIFDQQGDQSGGSQGRDH